MGKKKNRNRKPTVFIAREGDREELFLCYLKKLFDPEDKITLKFPPEKGGNSNAILDRALHSVHSNSYAWFDEDDELDDEHKEELKKRWHLSEDFPKNVRDFELQSYNEKMCSPIVVVSTPLSVEGILIRLFNKKISILKEPVKSEENLEENKRRMKSSLSGVYGNVPEEEYYRKNLPKEYIIKKAEEIEELKILLSIFN